MIKSLDFGFYSVDPDYLQYLNAIDSEVYYNPSYRAHLKPFVGVIIGLKEFKYFIPLSSAKRKHENWKNITKEHFLIYEIINIQTIRPKYICKNFSNNKKIHILAILDIKKMIPIPEGYYTKIDFKKLTDYKYKDLLKKEYKFCLTRKEKILSKAEKLYNEQKTTKIINKNNCNFDKLEKAMGNWCTN